LKNRCLSYSKVVALFVLTLTLMAVPAMANTWSQEFDSTTASSANYDPYNGYVAIMGAGGGSFATLPASASIFGFSAGAGWVVISDPYNPSATTTTQLIGSDISMQNTFYLDFASALTTPFQLEIYATENGTILPTSLQAYKYDGGGNGNSSQSEGDWSNIDPNTFTAVPEPASLMLMGSGLLGLAGFARRRFLKA
jgi:hypothetical protein